MESELAKPGGADVDKDGSAPGAVGVTPAWGDHQNIVDMERCRVDAVLA